MWAKLSRSQSNPLKDPPSLTQATPFVVILLKKTTTLNVCLHAFSVTNSICLTAYPHLLVQATNEQFLPARVSFRSGLASESHLVATSVGTHRSLVACINKCGWAITQY